MKKTILSILTVATMLFAASCSEEELTYESSNKQNVTFKVEMEGAGASSRALTKDGKEVGQGSMINKVYYAVYETGKDDLLVHGSETMTATEDGAAGSVVIPLVNGLKFDIVFFAQNEEASAFTIPSGDSDNAGDLRYIAFKTSLKANQESYDAFYKSVKGYQSNSNSTTPVKLTRAVAQLNVGTTEKDLDNAGALNALATMSKVELTNVYTKFDAREGVASEPAKVTFDASNILYDANWDKTTTGHKKYGNEILADVKTGDEGTEDFYYLAMAYVLANDESALHDAEFTFYRGEGENKEVISTRSLSYVRLQRNYRTNVTGNVLTQQEDFSISLDTSFGTNEHNYSVGDVVVVGTAADLQIAIANAKEGVPVEIQLGNDITLGSTQPNPTESAGLEIPAGATVILDLNGKKISGGYQVNSADKHIYPITNKGDLTITGGTIEGRGVGNYGTLTIKDGTVIDAVDTNGGGAIWNYTGSTVIIEGGTFTAADDTEAPGATTLNVAEGSTAIINGGKFIAKANQTYGIINAGTLTINDIEISSDHGVISSSGTTTINGGTYQQNGNLDQTSSLLYITDGETNISGGTFKFNVENKLDSGLPVYCAGGKVAISGGTFTGYVTEMISSWGGTGAATVTGGTFDKNPGFIAEGYEAVEENGVWTVSQKVVATVGGQSYSTFAEAISNAEDNATIELVEGDTYVLPSNSGSKTLTIKGTEETIIDVTKGSYWDSANLTFEGITIKTSTGYVMDANGNKGSDYAALYSPNVTYKNVTFVGPMRVGRDGAKFVNCTFTELGNDYVWTYGNDVTFEGCTFNTAGKAILIYSDGGNEVSQVSVKGCKFNATQGAKAGAIANQNCAAIEIHNYGNGVNLTTSGNTVDTDGEKFSGEWRIKEYVSNKPKVTVNGTEYTTIALDGKTMTIDADKNVTVNN